MIKRRARRQLQSGAARRDIRFQFYNAEQIQAVVPLPVHQAHLQSSNCLNILVDAAVSLQSRVAVSGPARLPVLAPNATNSSSSDSNPHSANGPALSVKDLPSSHPKSLLLQEVCSKTHQRETVCAYSKSPEPIRPNSRPTNEDGDYFALNDDNEILLISPFQSSHTTSAPTVDEDSDAQQVIKHLNNSATADMDGIAIGVVDRLEGGLSRGQ